MMRENDSFGLWCVGREKEDVGPYIIASLTLSLALFLPLSLRLSIFQSLFLALSLSISLPSNSSPLFISGRPSSQACKERDRD